MRSDTQVQVKQLGTYEIPVDYMRRIEITNPTHSGLKRNRSCSPTNSARGRRIPQVIRVPQARNRRDSLSVEAGVAHLRGLPILECDKGSYHT